MLMREVGSSRDVRARPRPGLDGAAYGAVLAAGAEAAPGPGGDGGVPGNVAADHDVDPAQQGGRAGGPGLGGPAGCPAGWSGQPNRAAITGLFGIAAQTARQAASRRPGRPRPIWRSCPGRHRGVVARAQPGVLDQGPRSGEPGRVTRLGQDRRGPVTVSPLIVVSSPASPSSSSTAPIRASVSASRARLSRQSPSARWAGSRAPGRCAVTPAGSASAANTARMIRRHGRIPPHRGSSRRTAAVNRSRPIRRTRRRSPAHRSSTTASDAHQLTDRKQAPRRGQHRGPGAFQQVADLVHRRRRPGRQLAAARPQVTQPRPHRIGPLRLVTAQLTRQPGDQHRVLRVRLVPGQVLTLPGPVGPAAAARTPAPVPALPRADPAPATGAR